MRSSQPECGFVYSNANVRTSVANQICFYDYIGSGTGGGSTGGTCPHRVLCRGVSTPTKSYSGRHIIQEFVVIQSVKGSHMRPSQLL